VLNDDPFDRERLRVNRARETKRAKPKNWRRYYVNVPWYWVEQLQTTKRASTYRVALWLLYEHWRTGGRPIVLSNVAVRQEGLTRYSKWRAITELQTQGLIEVEAVKGKAPRITLYHLSERPT
jgi:hypothetical protein